MDKDLENKIQNFAHDMTKLEEFCKAHETLYIYGAGKFGARYYSFIKDKYKVSGFVVSSEKDCGSFQGVPVISVSCLPACSSRAGIIPAFKGSSADDIKQKFPAGTVDVFDIESHDFMSYSSMIKPLHDIHERLKEYGPPASLPLPSRDAKVNILITRLDAIGDVICTTPLIREVRRNYPNAFITVVIREQNKELLENCPYIDELLLYDTGYEEPSYMEEDFDYDLIKAKTDAFIRNAFKRKYDIVFKATEVMAGRNMIQELLLVFGSGATWRIGHVSDYGDVTRSIIAYMFRDVFSCIPFQRFPMHEAIYKLDMIRTCGLKIEQYQPELWPSEENCKKMCQFIDNSRFTGVKHFVAVGLAGTLPRRSWPEKSYIELFDRIYEEYGDEIIFILFGEKEISQVGSRMEHLCKNVLDCTGKCSLNETIALIRKSELYLGANTGLLHIAAAEKKNAIVLYATCLSDGTYMKSDGPCRWGALGVVNYNLIPPAGLDGCHISCSKAEPHCITQIEVGQVEMALRCMINLSNNV